MNITLTKEQQAACDAILGWYLKDENDDITLGGYAGTGKSTLIAYLRETLLKKNPKLAIAFCCYTGKAAWNLKKKLQAANALGYNDYCGTIHSLIYEPVADEQGQILDWLRHDEIPHDLIIIDEASMVDLDIWRDLKSYEIPIIAVGDHGQLPPIASNSDEPFNLMDKPDLKLEKVHRQAEDNPIIKLSIRARKEGVIPVDNYGAKVKKLSKNNPETEPFLDSIFSNYNNDTLVLCATNRKRVELNLRIRKLLGFTDNTPKKGERVICLKNNRFSTGCAIFNGMTGTISDIEPSDKHWYKAAIEMDGEPSLYLGKISRYFFDNINRELSEKLAISHSETGDHFDRGYALTVHKAQGSEASRVVVFEEAFMGSDRRRWLYTAVTRAKSELTIISR